MIDLFMIILTGGGGVGFGSILKMVANKLNAGNIKESNSSRIQLIKDLIREAKDGDWDEIKIKLFLDVLNEDTEGGMFARHTRRMLALIGVSVFAAVTVHCILFAADPFITLPAIALGGGEHAEGWSILFGLFTIPPSTEPIQLTLGHIGLMNCITLGMILGFYFTPDGSAK